MHHNVFVFSFLSFYTINVYMTKPLTFFAGFNLDNCQNVAESLILFHIMESIFIFNVSFFKTAFTFV